MTSPRAIRAGLLCLTWAAAALAAAEPSPAPEKGPPAPPADEKLLRERFFTAYTAAAEQPAARADALLLLRDVTEPQSLRLVAGLLGDPAPEVRRQACQLMGQLPDPQAYFVKPLITALHDQASAVRVAAATAMGAARVRSQAVRVLVLTLADVAEGKPVETAFLGALHRALRRLTNAAISQEVTPRELARFWTDWWQENRDALAASDRAYLEGAGPGAPPAIPPAPPAEKRDPPAVQAPPRDL